MAVRHLLSDVLVSRYLIRRLDEVLTTVRSADADRLEGPGEEDFVQLTQVDEVKVDTSQVSRSEPLEAIEVVRDPDGGVRTVESIRYVFRVPCTGATDLLRYSPDQGPDGPQPEFNGEVRDTVVEFDIVGPKTALAGGGIRKQLDAHLAALEANVQALNTQAVQHNADAEAKVREAVAQRRGELASLGSLDSELADIPIFDDKNRRPGHRW
jgi:hypothetical protein